MPGVDTSQMTREEYLLFRGRNEKITITDADLACARHRDSCANCQDNDRSAHAREQAATRSEEARGVLASGVTQFRQELEGLLQRHERAGDPLPSAEAQIKALIAGLRRISDAGNRAWKK